MNNITKPRLAIDGLKTRLEVMPAVVVLGARQTGKTTMVRELIPGQRQFFSLDDLSVVDLALRQPESILGGPRPVTIDEIQREPSLLRSIKGLIDRQRRAGQFLLTGSANLLLMRQAAESLAGRASYLTLWPMTRREQLGLTDSGAWSGLLSADDDDWLDYLSGQSGPRGDWRALAIRGGFPTPTLHLNSDSERAIWFDGYIQTYLERDLQTISSVAFLPDFRRLMRAAALRTGQLLNQTELGRDVGLSQSTSHRYLNLLETAYLLVKLPAYAVNRTKRLVKSPKLYWSDVGLGLHLAQSAPAGCHLENLVLHDLLVWRDTDRRTAEIFYWRTVSGEEIDFVIETEGKLLPIEVKATRQPRLRDAAGLLAFRRVYGADSRPGLLLHDGEMLDWLAPGVLAAPWWLVL